MSSSSSTLTSGRPSGTPASPNTTTNTPTTSSNNGKKSSAARRNALREFYKLSSTPKPETINEDDDDDDNFENRHGDEDLDKYMSTLTTGATNGVDGYVARLVEQHDLRGLLKQENTLVNEIKTLDSEGKALVYNNYSKLTAASTTLHGLRTEVEGLTSGRKLEDLQSALSIVAKEAVIVDNNVERELPQLPHSNAVKAANWISNNALQTIQSFIAAGNKKAALECSTKSIALLDKWIKTDQLDSPQLLKLKDELSKCTSILDVEI